MLTLRKRKRRASAIVPLGLVVAAGGILIASCDRTAPATESQANDKRWANFQKDNKRDMAVGNSAFERRQAQLAEQKRKAAEGKTPAKPAAETTTPGKP